MSSKTVGGVLRERERVGAIDCSGRSSLLLTLSQSGTSVPFFIPSVCFFLSVYQQNSGLLEKRKAAMDFMKIGELIIID